MRGPSSAPLAPSLPQRGRIEQRDGSGRAVATQPNRRSSQGERHLACVRAAWNYLVFELISC
jgi:hypothetical protein